QPADAGDDEAHEDRQVVDQQSERHVERAALDPGPVGEVAVRLAHEQGHGGQEGQPHHAGAHYHGDGAGRAPPAPRQDHSARGGKEEKQKRDEPVAHPFSSLRSSMSSASRTRKMSTRIASPTTASAAATVSDLSANRW